ncbi:hypothetical protein Aeqsu_3077 [Aequorivita sublithincola DSM 14238]|uniref:Uncharacterized protein n=1 Tax=Aequorivita sublithincola (strain DSM 14238 / LMG 21431 / ACAM 643 / 9-3) TaxID=746697 RepID=I3YZU6_AEQSU|nr:hypothetical protein [Aequorivita sublithincola]AFL82514.1 hypothetical protein Aeqsu_3077 [Aequorivita sublithincola DSM 14238]
MAKQTGIIKLKGTIDDIAFYKTADGHLARAKGGVDRDKIKHSAAFARTRENNSEFGTAGKGGKLVRSALRSLMQNAKDNRVVSRLTTALLAIIKTDPVNKRGQRNLDGGNLVLLEGFDFNSNGKLDTTFFGLYTPSFDRVSGDATIAIDAFNASERIAAPSGTTHYKLAMAATELDFENKVFVYNEMDLGIQPYDSAPVLAATLTASVTPNSTLPVLTVMGIEFYQEVNGEFYSLKNGAFNALGVVEVSEI